MNNAALVRIDAGTLLHKDDVASAVVPLAMHAFAIGVHLVTVAEYAVFIDDGGYADPAWWSPEGWSWRLDEDVERPRFWGEAEGGDAEVWAPYLEPTHPVVGVSGYEAEAYASYRGLRLPTELEWERACRADDGRDYPWGNEWDDTACGHRNHGTRCTKPVGFYPKCVSPFGVFDLCGNVWQWTSDVRGEIWVVRGGAWNNLPWSIGSAGRNGYAPRARFSNLGFRLAGDPDDATL
jgi:iron(II)-dependent oxidoreductase